MRRLALSVLTACGLALLSACAGGYGLSSGTGPSSTQPSFFTFTNGSGEANDFFVSPASTAPTYASQALQVNAIAEHNSGGGLTTVVPDVAATWAARFVNPATDPFSIASYTVGAVISGVKACPAKPAITPTVPLYVQTSNATLTPLANGQGAQTIYIGAVPGVAAPYCLVLQATAPNGVIGTVTVVVSNSP